MKKCEHSKMTDLDKVGIATARTIARYPVAAAEVLYMLEIMHTELAPVAADAAKLGLVSNVVELIEVLQMQLRAGMHLR